MTSEPRGRLRRFALWLVAVFIRRRVVKRGEQEYEPERSAAELEREREQRQAVERLESEPGARPGEPIAPEEERAEESERLDQLNQRIRRRRAEPPPTKERETEVHPRSEWVVIVALLGGALGAAVFMVLYVALPDTQLLGLALGLALASLAIAAIVAGKRVVPQEKVAEEYHYYGDEEQQQDVDEILREAGEGISRRKLMAGAAGLAGATLGAAALFPAASLGPNVGERVYATPWRRGRRVVSSRGQPITADDVVPGTFMTAFPEGASRSDLGAPILLTRVPPDELELPAARRRGAPEGVVAYSKICTHAGCAVSIFRNPLFRPTDPRPAFVCPCHYSTFDPRRGGKVLFGPAARDLPQLPLRIGPLRELEADGDFYDPIGPSYGGSRLAPDRDVKPGGERS